MTLESELVSFVGGVASPIIAAVVYSLYTYSGKYLTDNDTFLFRKFLRTVLVGVIVGVVAVYTGHELSLGTFEALAASVGAIHIADVAVKVFWEWLVELGVIPEGWSGRVDIE